MKEESEMMEISLGTLVKQEDFREQRASGTISFLEEVELLPRFMF